MESKIGKEIYVNYGAMHSQHYGMVVGYKTTTIREESVKEYKVWWFERGEDSGETSWVPECTIRTEGETTANGSSMGFYWQTRPMLSEEFAKEFVKSS